MTMDIDHEAVPDYRALLRLEGRVFVVLGAGLGIGRQTAHALAQAGAKLVCVDNENSLAEAVAAEVDGIPLCADITRRSDVERVFALSQERAGPVRGLVDIVGMPLRGPVLEMDDARWQQQFDVVLNHAILAVQIGGKAMIQAGGGAMVFVGSLSGVGNFPGHTAYGVAKAGLHHLVECMGKELAPQGVRVNAVAPGMVRTPRLNAMRNEEDWKKVGRLIPRGFAGRAWEIAGPILFLCSDLSNYVTGQVLNTDGGLMGVIHPPQAWTGS